MRCPPSRRSLLATALAWAVCSLAAPAAKPPPFRLAPGAVVEAEDFRIERGWKVVFNGRGNYMVDIIGFNHISGERLLHADKADTTASAAADVQVPAAGNYRLWVRYEYPTFTDTRFRVTLRQGGKAVAEKLMGAKDNPRLAFGDTELKAQYDPPWGSEGLVEEAVDAKGLKAGPARVTLETVAQPQVPGRTADRNIDLVYLSSDTKDSWREHYRKRNRLYPILDAVRDTVGPRWEVRLANTADAPARLTIYHVYNRIPWGVSEGVASERLARGAATDWLPLRGQDTAHFGMTRVNSKAGSFAAEVRPCGGGKVLTFASTGDILRRTPSTARGPSHPSSSSGACWNTSRRSRRSAESPRCRCATADGSTSGHPASTAATTRRSTRRSACGAFTRPFGASGTASSRTSRKSASR